MTPRRPDVVPNIVPAFRYRDAPAAVEWLIKAFGFEKQLVVPGEDGTIAHAELGFGPGIIMLGSVPKEPKDASMAATYAMYVYVEDVDSHYQRAKAAGAEIIRELQDTPHGSREYAARDPDGFLWGFGNYRPQASLNRDPQEPQ